MVRGYFRSNVDEMTGYVPGEQPAAGAKVVKLNTNENPYSPSPKVLEAVARSGAETLRLYPDPTARGLREAASRAYGFGPECIVAGNGSDELLAMLVRAFASEAAAGIRNGRLEVVDDCGHLIPLEEPQLVARRIIESATE